MLPSNVSHLHHHTHDQGMSGKPHQSHLTLLTPPQSSRSSFAQLPSTTAPPPTWISASPQLASQGGSSVHFDRLTSFHSGRGQDEDEYDFDPEEAEDEDEDAEEDEDEEDQDEFGRGSQLVGARFDRLASLREPSPSGMLLFSTDDPEHFDVLDLDEARQAEDALVALAGPITSVLTQYRTQFNQWELELNPPQSVIHASTLIDQCLAKFVYSLEPLKWVVDDLFQFGCLLNQFNAFLSERKASGDQSLESDTRLWNGLNRLADHVISVEEGLSDTTFAINELCDWVDGLLTPALAEVKFSTAKDNERVSKILDVHSYLCESLVKAYSILTVYLNCLKRIGSSLQRYQTILSSASASNSIHQFPIHQAVTWSSKWTSSLTPLINSMTVFHAISECIQIHTAGRLSSTLSSEATAFDDKDSVILYSQTPLPSSDTKSDFPHHSISYA